MNASSSEGAADDAFLRTLPIATRAVTAAAIGLLAILGLWAKAASVRFFLTEWAGQGGRGEAIDPAIGDVLSGRVCFRRRMRRKRGLFGAFALSLAIETALLSTCTHTAACALLPAGFPARVVAGDEYCYAVEAVIVFCLANVSFGGLAVTVVKALLVKSYGAVSKLGLERVVCAVLSVQVALDAATTAAYLIDDGFLAIMPTLHLCRGARAPAKALPTGFDLFALFSLLTGSSIVLDLCLQLWLVAGAALHNNVVAARVVRAATLRSRNRRAAASLGTHAVLSAAKVASLTVYVALWWSTKNKASSELFFNLLNVIFSTVVPFTEAALNSDTRKHLLFK